MEIGIRGTQISSIILAFKLTWLKMIKSVIGVKPQTLPIIITNKTAN